MSKTYVILNRNLNVYGSNQGFVPGSDDEIATFTNNDNGNLRNDKNINLELQECSNLEDYVIILMSRNQNEFYGYTQIEKIIDHEIGKRIHCKPATNFIQRISVDDLNAKTGGMFTFKKITHTNDIDLIEKEIKKTQKL